MNENLSTHKCEVVQLDLHKLENSDNLSYMDVFGGYKVVVNTKDWENKTKAAYVVPDSEVPLDRPEFLFLYKQGKSYHRVTAKKLRGVISYGLLVPVPDNFQVGDNVWEYFGLRRYEPVEFHGAKTQGCVAKPPAAHVVKYDVDSFQRWAKTCLVDNEPLFCTEKIHGANSRFLYENGQMFCGSRTLFKKEFDVVDIPSKEELLHKVNDPVKVNEILQKITERAAKPSENMWWRALRNTPQLENFCKEKPGHVVYGEVYGQVQKGYHYDCKPNQVKFRAFDIMINGSWLNPLERYDLLNKFQVPVAPILSDNYPFSFEEVVSKFASGQSTLNNSCIREGCVIEPLIGRYHEKAGRVKFKCINPSYLGVK